MRIYNNIHADTYKRLEKLSFFVFLSNLPNFFIVSYSAAVSNTVVVWVDALVSLGETLHSLIVWLVARAMRKETGDKYNYGMARLEVFVSLICDMLIAVGMLGVLVSAVYSIQSPTAPGDSLILFCIVKVSNSLFDLYFLVKQIRLCREHDSKLNQTEKLGYKIALINDVTVGVVALICYIFRSYAFVQYFSPIVSILLTLWFLFNYVKRIRVSIDEISDASLPVKQQDEIYDVVMQNREFVKRIIAVNCRRLNDTTYVEITLEMQSSTTYAQMTEYLKELQPQIASLDSTAVVKLVIGNEKE